MNPRITTPENQETFTLAYDHAELTGDLTVKFFKVPLGKRLLIDAVDYCNPTGLAAHGSDFFFLSLNNGSDKAAGWLTDDDATTTGINGGADEGSLPADEWVSWTLNSDPAKRLFAAGDILSLVFDETGTATLPPGRVVIRGRYV